MASCEPDEEVQDLLQGQRRHQPRRRLPARRRSASTRSRTRSTPEFADRRDLARRVRRQRRPQLAQPEPAGVARRRVADRPRRDAGLPPQLADRATRSSPARSTLDDHVLATVLRRRRSAAHDGARAAGHRASCSTEVVALVPDVWLRDEPGLRRPRRGARRVRRASSAARLDRAARVAAGRWRRERDRIAFEYALLRVVPRVERGESVNVGVLRLRPVRSPTCRSRPTSTPRGCSRSTPTLDVAAVRASLARRRARVRRRRRRRTGRARCPRVSGSAGSSRRAAPSCSPGRAHRHHRRSRRRDGTAARPPGADVLTCSGRGLTRA